MKFYLFIAFTNDKVTLDHIINILITNHGSTTSNEDTSLGIKYKNITTNHITVIKKY